MRATERILEHVSERADEVSEWLSRIEKGDPGALGDAITDVAKLRLDIHAVQLAIAELRQRGDTLVRKDDLRRVLEWIDTEDPPEPADLAKSIERLENALGGTP
jgi:hypothetical protein